MWRKVGKRLYKQRSNSNLGGAAKAFQEFKLCFVRFVGAC